MKLHLLLLLSCFSLWANELIIVHGDKGSLSKTEVKEIYLGQKQQWRDGSKIHLATYDKGNLAEIFTKKYLGKRHSQFLLYWKQLLFTGRGVMPQVVKTEEEMIRYVKKTPGAIGYISNIKVDGISIIRVRDAE